MRVHYASPEPTLQPVSIDSFRGGSGTNGTDKHSENWGKEQDDECWII